MAAAPEVDIFAGTGIEHKYADLNGQRYHYLLGNPSGSEPKATVFLIHGWPDCSAGWRHQLTMLRDAGYRCVAPDMMGYGGTAAPEAETGSDRLSLYGFKRAADDIKELALQLGCSRIILGGHDWGGAIVYRVALWYPELISHLFAICTPYFPPGKEYVTTEDMVQGPLPQFQYQIHLASGEVEGIIHSEERIRQFLSGMYGGRGPNKEAAFDVYKGVLGENLPKIGKPLLLSPKELDYYVQEYARHGIHSTLNWYRTRKVNFEEELSLEKSTIDIPTLFIAASKDSALPPSMSASMGKFIPRLTRMEVDASHWAPVEMAGEVNVIIKAWLAAATRGEPKSNL